MAKWIYLAALFNVGAALPCKEGTLRMSDGHCFFICRHSHWVLDRCVGTIRNTTENLPCQDGESYKNLDEPGIYYQCKNNKLVLKRCASGQEFDKVKKICHTPPAVGQSQYEDSGRDTILERFEPDKNDGDICEENILYADVFDFTAYYTCEHGILVSQACYDGTVFDSEKQQCVSTHSSQLDVANSIMAKAGQCTHGESRRKEGSCKEYYECMNGTEIISRCMECQNYDHNEKKCRYVFDSPCRSLVPESSTTSAPEDLTTVVPGISTSSTTTASVTEIIDTSTSITNDGGSSPSPTEVSTTMIPPTDSSEPGSTALPFGDCKKRRALPDCKYYLECHEGELVTRRCGWLQYFDSLTTACSFMGYTCYGTQ